MKKIFEVLGITQSPVSHAEKIVSTVGGFVAIFSVFTINQWLVGSYVAAIIVASMGATAVLLFVLPHSQLSQPWSLIAGHIVSAVVGVACAQLFLQVNII